MKSIMELASCGLSANLVGPGFKEGESSRPKLSAIVMRSLVWEECDVGNWGSSYYLLY